MLAAGQLGRTNMGRSVFIRLFALGAVALALSGSVATARIEMGPLVLPPTYQATLKHNARCLFRLSAKWERTPVSAVTAQWYLDGVFLLTTEAPGTGPNAGVISAKGAMMEAGPTNTSASGHAWKALVQFYSSSGAQLASVWSNVDNARCGT